MTTANPLRKIPDVNLSLAILSRLMDLGTVPLFEVPAPEDVHECDDECDDDCADWVDHPSEYEYRKEVARALLDLPVTAEQCATLRELNWHTSSKAISMIWKYWDGECDTFSVRSLDGISAALPALEALRLELNEVTDLTPLTRCGRLRELALVGGYDNEADLAPLSRVGSLRTLSLASRTVRDLSPLTVLELEHLTLDGCHDVRSRNVVDLAPLEHMPSLRTVNYRRFVRTRGDEHPVLTAFDNARVIESLGERGVTLAFE
ncbi:MULTISPECIES: DUF6892 domain-containing protein [unclassified Streptomyces]|uniref:DUF6892 domain-containing protein n=1 Tax=unclassified Streptomyces TaxID=2593676 RepID=UPI0036E1648C